MYWIETSPVMEVTVTVLGPCCCVAWGHANPNTALWSLLADNSRPFQTWASTQIKLIFISIVIGQSPLPIQPASSSAPTSGASHFLHMFWTFFGSHLKKLSLHIDIKMFLQNLHQHPFTIGYFRLFWMKQWRETRPWASASTWVKLQPCHRAAWPAAGAEPLINCAI